MLLLLLLLSVHIRSGDQLRVPIVVVVVMSLLSLLLSFLSPIVLKTWKQIAANDVAETVGVFSCWTLDCIDLTAPNWVLIKSKFIKTIVVTVLLYS